MLDVHPAHHAAHSWRDFLIHIATIVVGLLIAVGLEQTVEFFHHRHQLLEVRRELAEERDLNRKLLQRNEGFTQEMEEELHGDLELLRLRQAGDHSSLSGKLHYDWVTYAAATGAWQSAAQNGTLSLMPAPELRVFAYRYYLLSSYMQAATGFASAIEKAGAIARSSADGNLSTDDASNLIQATRDAQGELALSSKFLHFAVTYGLKDEDEQDYSFLQQPPPHLSDWKAARGNLTRQQPGLP